jgi:hypothetical protein
MLPSCHCIRQTTPSPANVTAAKGDVADTGGMAAAFEGHDAVVSSARAAGTRRYLVAGGAASLEVAPGKRLLMLRSGAADLGWTLLSPSALFGAGERTGGFHLGKDELIVGDKGFTISFADCATSLKARTRPHSPRPTGQRRSARSD